MVRRRRAERNLLHREAFEALIARISMRFVELSASEVDYGIDWALKELGEFAGVDRSYVFRFSSDGEKVARGWGLPLTSK